MKRIAFLALLSVLFIACAPSEAELDKFRNQTFPEGEYIPTDEYKKIEAELLDSLVESKYHGGVKDQATLLEEILNQYGYSIEDYYKTYSKESPDGRKVLIKNYREYKKGRK